MYAKRRKYIEDTEITTTKQLGQRESDITQKHPYVKRVQWKDHISNEEEMLTV